MATRPRARSGAVAVAFAVYAGLSAATGVALVLARAGTVDDVAGYLVITTFSLVDAVLVTVLLTRLPRHPVTVTLAAGLALSLLGNGPSLAADALGATTLSETLGNLGWLGGVPFLPLLFAVFPDEWARGYRRRVAVADVVALTLLVPVSTPLGEYPPLRVVAVACAVVLLGTGVFGAVSLGVHRVRHRGAAGGTGTFAAVACAVAAAFLVGAIEAFPLESLTFSLIVYGPPIAVGYGVLRHRLFGLDVAVRRVAVAVALSLVVFAAYLGAVYGVASVAGVSRDALAPAVLPAIVAAAALAPLYRAALRAVDRRLYGDRRDPWAVMRRLGGDLAAASPDEVPALLAQRTREALRLPWVGLELDREGTLVAVADGGVRDEGPVEAFELRHAGSRVGQLLVQPRRGQPGLDRRDRRALAQVAADVSPAVSAARLVDELTQSRERLVIGREAERGRLRRELHDGLGPSLAGMSLALSAARAKLGPADDDALRLLGNVQEEAARAWQTVRGVLADLRPPGLEELGLVGALEDAARRLDRAEEFAVEVRAGALPALPAAVEVAAFRIATEAMTNAARHSAGHRCRVDLRADGQLDIVVSDDGDGIAGEPGIGLRSMTERADDLGGWVSVDAGAAGGTVVHARLPLAVTS